MRRGFVRRERKNKTRDLKQPGAQRFGNYGNILGHTSIREFNKREDKSYL